MCNKEKEILWICLYNGNNVQQYELVPIHILHFDSKRIFDEIVALYAHKDESWFYEIKCKNFFNKYTCLFYLLQVQVPQISRSVVILSKSSPLY